MAIIRSAAAREAHQPERRMFRQAEVPFVPAWDLLQRKESSLGEQEAAAIALALFNLTSDTAVSPLSAWTAQARLEAVAQRM